jgi:hypothetical protein
VPTFSRRTPYEKRRSLMTGRRNDAGSRWAAVAIAALLLFGALALSGCAALDPDGGASLAVGKEYAPTPIKLNVIEAMKVQGFSYSNYNYLYVTYPSLTDTSAVAVNGLMYGPSGTKGVLDIYKALKLTRGDDGLWKIVESVKGTPTPEPGENGTSEEGTSAAGASAESSAASETPTK